MPEGSPEPDTAFFGSLRRTIVGVPCGLTRPRGHKGKADTELHLSPAKTHAEIFTPFSETFGLLIGNRHHSRCHCFALNVAIVVDEQL